MRHTRLLLLALAFLAAAVPARAQQITVGHAATGSTDAQPIAARTKGQRIVCFALTETTGSARASVTPYIGTSNAGTKLPTITLAANESTQKCYPSGEGPSAAAGVFVTRTGTVEVWVIVRELP